MKRCGSGPETASAFDREPTTEIPVREGIYIPGMHKTERETASHFVEHYFCSIKTAIL